MIRKVFPILCLIWAFSANAQYLKPSDRDWTPVVTAPEGVISVDYATIMRRDFGFTFWMMASKDGSVADFSLKSQELLDCVGHRIAHLQLILPGTNGRIQKGTGSFRAIPGGTAAAKLMAAICKRAQTPPD